MGSHAKSHPVLPLTAVISLAWCTDCIRSKLSFSMRKLMAWNMLGCSCEPMAAQYVVMNVSIKVTFIFYFFSVYGHVETLADTQSFVSGTVQFYVTHIDLKLQMQQQCHK